MRAPAPNLDDPAVYRSLDPTHMAKRLESLPDQVRQAWADAMRLELPADYRRADKVVLAGMGGSGVGGDLLADLLALERGGPVFAVGRDYRLPPWVDAKTLALVSSYSGTTEETLSCFHEALERSAKVVVITSGGPLRAGAEARHLPVLAVPDQGEPRTALGYSFIAPLVLLQRAGLLPDRADELRSALVTLEAVSRRYGPGQSADANEAKRLAQALEGHLVVVYGGGVLSGVARRWKTQINENSKGWAFAEALPELNHNAVMGYQFPRELGRRIFVVLLRSSLLHPRTLGRYAVTVELLEQHGVPHRVLDAEGQTALGQMLSTIALGDWASYYLALLNGIDPSPVEAVSQVKRRLATG